MAARQIARSRAWGALIGFVLVFWLSRRAGLPFPESGGRAPSRRPRLPPAGLGRRRHRVAPAHPGPDRRRPPRELAAAQQGARAAHDPVEPVGPVEVRPGRSSAPLPVERAHRARASAIPSATRASASPPAEPRAARRRAHRRARLARVQADLDASQVPLRRGDQQDHIGADMESAPGLSRREHVPSHQHQRGRPGGPPLPHHDVGRRSRSRWSACRPAFASTRPPMTPPASASPRRCAARSAGSLSRSATSRTASRWCRPQRATSTRSTASCSVSVSSPCSTRTARSRPPARAPFSPRSTLCRPRSPASRVPLSSTASTCSAPPRRSRSRSAPTTARPSRSRSLRSPSAATRR